ncbi:MAG: LytTR family DNA-binding domain-containing protein [Geminicoccaceae bacterium]
MLALIVSLAAFAICGLFLLMTVPIGIAPDEFAVTSPHAQAKATPTMAAAASSSDDAKTTGRRSSRDAALSKAFTDPPAPASDMKAPRIPYQQDDTIRFLSPDDIFAIKAQGHYTDLINDKEGELFCPWPLSKLEKILEEAPFLRTHRSFLVNLRHVAGFRRDGDKGFCLLGEGAALKEIPVSRSQIPAVQKALGLD